VTAEESQRHLYERELRKHFTVVWASSTREAPGAFDAVVYDLPKARSSVDFRWLKQAAVPVVMLTPDERLRLPEAPRRSVLAYPVRMNQILTALAQLGVCAGGEC
jgi:hypothetical protein